jgi:hypothetical protein
MVTRLSGLLGQPAREGRVDSQAEDRALRRWDELPQAQRQERKGRRLARIRAEVARACRGLQSDVVGGPGRVALSGPTASRAVATSLIEPVD